MMLLSLPDNDFSVASLAGFPRSAHPLPSIFVPTHERFHDSSCAGL